MILVQVLWNAILLTIKVLQYCLTLSAWSALFVARPKINKAP